VILRYKGKKEYRDPQGRFIAREGDLVDFPEAEALQLTKKKNWEEVTGNGNSRKGRRGSEA